MQRLVRERQVVRDIRLFRAEHLRDAPLDDGGSLVGKGWVVRPDVRIGGGEQLRRPVLMLQALPEQCRAPGSATEQEPSCSSISQLPDRITRPLESEHRVEEVEGDGGDARRDVAGSCGLEGGDGASFRDALLEDLPIGGVRSRPRSSPLPPR